MGVVLLVTFVATTTTGVVRVYRARHNETGLQPTDGLSDLLPSRMGASLWRCQALIAEAVVVRQRLSGEIDAETYQVRMKELARQEFSERRSQPNA
ncbi:hypothetical protein OQ968_03820 [Mycobacterium sp. 663a-19]|uniref:hypothetical protein n=1 Tax=Mycobacterium sp. 663a-19 TaxID=2986148 RepID=UPI002D1E84BA|nr:hypothetical protein [Mycobacterium sp. 663a-19]MEB3980386.1 hypothetical protein [Mycobacterium sp. 663a-19]